LDTEAVVSKASPSEAGYRLQNRPGFAAWFDRFEDNGVRTAAKKGIALDDVAAIAKVAAASLDDVVAQTAKAGAKAVGVVIDDAAVTPRYVVGFAASRELSIVAKIAIGSLRNKLLFLMPAALALSAFAPGAITPLLRVAISASKGQRNWPKRPFYMPRTTRRMSRRQSLLTPKHLRIRRSRELSALT
jgi:hypothetical protein